MSDCPSSAFQLPSQRNTAQLALVHAVVHNAHLDIDSHSDRVSDRLTCSGHGWRTGACTARHRRKTFQNTLSRRIPTLPGVVCAWTGVDAPGVCRRRLSSARRTSHVATSHVSRRTWYVLRGAHENRSMDGRLDARCAPGLRHRVGRSRHNLRRRGRQPAGRARRGAAGRYHPAPAGR